MGAAWSGGESIALGNAARRYVSGCHDRDGVLQPFLGREFSTAERSPFIAIAKPPSPQTAITGRSGSRPSSARMEAGLPDVDTEYNVEGRAGAYVATVTTNGPLGLAGGASQTVVHQDLRRGADAPSRGERSLQG